MAVKDKVVEDMTIGEIKLYKCTKCGKGHESPVNKFYKSTWSQLWNDNGKYCPVCKKCLDKLFDEYSRRYKSDQVALMILCHYIDIPFYYSLYDSLVKNNSNFSVGMYTRLILNNKQYQYKTFVNTLVDKKELGVSEDSFEKQKEVKWSIDDISHKNDVIKIIGYDPFEGYTEEDRRFLFNELIKYFDDDSADDPYKLSQIIQIVNNNNQIRKYDLIISGLNPFKDSNDIETFGSVKAKLVQNNDKIAKENEISVKNRSNKNIGKSTLTYLMRDLREKDFYKAEANYYDQLQSEGTRWAEGMSLKALKQNGFFDENDKQEILEINRGLILDIQAKLDSALEEIRLLTIENNDLKNENNKLKHGDNNE